MDKTTILLDIILKILKKTPLTYDEVVSKVIVQIATLQRKIPYLAEAIVTELCNAKTMGYIELANDKFHLCNNYEKKPIRVPESTQSVLKFEKLASQQRVLVKQESVYCIAELCRNVLSHNDMERKVASPKDNRPNIVKTKSRYESFLKQRALLNKHPECNCVDYSNNDTDIGPRMTALGVTPCHLLPQRTLRPAIKVASRGNSPVIPYRRHRCANMRPNTRTKRQSRVQPSKSQISQNKRKPTRGRRKY